jgi:hypothetical protein
MFPVGKGDNDSTLKLPLKHHTTRRVEDGKVPPETKVSEASGPHTLHFSSHGPAQSVSCSSFRSAVEVHFVEFRRGLWTRFQRVTVGK